jgi:hypothetical protein
MDRKVLLDAGQFMLLNEIGSKTRNMPGCTICFIMKIIYYAHEKPAGEV